MEEFNEKTIVSDKVQSMARGIYQEFERMMRKYDEDVVKNLMPMVVTLLECMESSYLQAEEANIELELIKEENEQLLVQYEKEKTLKSSLEQKYIELDDILESHKHDSKDRIKSLESIVHIMEIKAKNATDYANRLEEKENEWKKDYNKLHDRYTELFKTHLDYKERTRIISKIDSPSEDDNNPGYNNNNINQKLFPNTSSSNSYNPAYSRILETDSSHTQNFNEQLLEFDTEGNLNEQPENNVRDSGYSANECNQNSGEEDVTTTASDHIFAMGREVENLIEENSELLATKNALNIVKDDLINRVDELTSEQEILREEIYSLQRINENLLHKVESLEKELKIARTKDTSKFSLQNPILEGDEEDIPPGLRKRFTRLEMARVILERNEFKEKWLELQEALRWSETIRAARNERSISTISSNSPSTNKSRDIALLTKQLRLQSREKRYREERSPSPGRSKASYPSNSNTGVSSIWNFFSQLLRGGNVMESPSDSGTATSPDDHFTSQNTAGNVIPVFTFNKAREKIIPGVKKMQNITGEDEGKGKRRQKFDIRSSISPWTSQDRKVDEIESSQRFQAYGWSLPIAQSRYIFPSTSLLSYNNINQTKNRLQGMSIPVPIYCRPLSTNRHRLSGCKILCASPVDLSGGLTRDGGKICGASVFYSLRNNTNDISLNQGPPQHPLTSQNEIKQLENELETEMSSSKDLSASQMPSREIVNNNNLSYDVTDFTNISTLIWVACTSYTSPYDTSSTNNSRLSQPQHHIHPTTPVSRPTPCIVIIDATDPSNILDYFTLPIPSTTNAKSDTPFLRNIKTSTFNSQYKPEEEEDLEIPEECNDILCITTVPGISDSHYDDIASSINGDALGISIENNKQHPLSQAHNDHHREDNLCSNENLRNIDESSLINFPLEEAHKMSTLMPTMWIGLQNGIISIHSSVCYWDKPILTVRLRDSVLSLLHFKGKVYAGLANGTICIFSRNSDGLWDVNNFNQIHLSKCNKNVLVPEEEEGDVLQPVRCIQSICDKYVWASQANTIYSINPTTTSNEILRSFETDARSENHIANLIWCGGVGVWISYRMSVTLSLINALTFEVLLKMDLQPFLSEIAENEIYNENIPTVPLFSHLDRITSLTASCHSLWIGTAKGSIISIPFSKPPSEIVSNITTNDTGTDLSFSSKYQLHSDPFNSSNFIVTQNFIPWCRLKDARFSFHAHREPVKFLIAVPVGRDEKSYYSSTYNNTSNNFDPNSDVAKVAQQSYFLLLSGGEGYLDYRNDSSSTTSYTTQTNKILSSSLIDLDQNNITNEKMIDKTKKLKNTTDDIINNNVAADEDTKKLERFIQRNLENSYVGDNSGNRGLTRSLIEQKRRKNIPHLIVWRLEKL